jgi:hypothetical protein
MITRRTVVGGIATLAASEACAQRLSVIGAPAFNKYSNEVPWSLDTTNHPISSFVPTTTRSTPTPHLRRRLSTPAISSNCSMVMARPGNLSSRHLARERRRWSARGWANMP